MLLDPEDSSVETIRVLIVGLAAAHNVIVWIFHLCYTSFSPGKNRIHWLSIYALTLTVIASVVFTVAPWFTSSDSYKGTTSLNLKMTLTDSSCQWIAMSIKLMFLFPKAIGLYFVYFERLFYIFRDSAYAFKPIQKWSFRMLLIIPVSFSTILVYFNKEHTYVLDPDTNACSMALDRNGVIFSIIGDTLFCNLLSFLYCRRLLIFRSRLTTRFLNNAAGAGGVHPGLPGAGNPPPAELVALNRIFKVMMKSTVLQFVAMLSSQSLVILMMVMGVASLWAAIDSVVNCWCLVLMFDLYDDLFRLYPFCCGLCEKLMCYHCIVCYSCHCCCRVNYGEISRPQIELT